LTPSPPSSSLRGVSKEYPAARVRALSDVDLDLPAGVLTVLLGANGAGKTTLLRILAGLLAPSAGTVEVLGMQQPAESRRRELRRRVTYISQEPALDPEMTGGETLSLLAALYGVTRKDRAQRTAELADAFGLQNHLGRPVRIWSGGLKRRLHLAAGMIHDPELLLLDEPTAGLDVEGNDFLWAELGRRAREGRAVAVVTHDLAAAERHAGRIAILDEGRIVAIGEPTNLAELYRRATGRDPAVLAPRGKGL
jgi:ABC-type multidrug transport system ATPase subunit